MGQRSNRKARPSHAITRRLSSAESVAPGTALSAHSPGLEVVDDFGVEELSGRYDRNSGWIRCEFAGQRYVRQRVRRGPFLFGRKDALLGDDTVSS